MRWTGKRLFWEDILELIKDRILDGQYSKEQECWTKITMGIAYNIRFVFLFFLFENC